MAKFKASRAGRYGAIRGTSGQRYELNKSREISVTNDADIAYFKRHEAFDYVEPPAPKKTKSNPTIEADD